MCQDTIMIFNQMSQDRHLKLELQRKSFTVLIALSVSDVVSGVFLHLNDLSSFLHKSGLVECRNFLFLECFMQRFINCKPLAQLIWNEN